MQNDFDVWQQQNDFVPQTKSTIPDMPMKWHKFLIYFSLWAGAIMNVLTGIGTLTGSIYAGEGVDPEMIYRVFGGLKAVDVLMGVVFIALAVLLIVARFALAGYKKNGPKLLVIAYAANIALALIYPIMVAAVTGLSFGDLFDVSTLISSGIMLVVNKIYYDKRAHLFVN